ncbi:MAG: prolipoprotein diacylglyceryl transferase [Ignavibacteriae bacterium HGW-Ignavibacteriae-4]|nr:MAG: prolipoprotein diacylglyceryl transferase [Ignavibacteriae bacterium HGW-Ignavibacteriae-4]
MDFLKRRWGVTSPYQVAVIFLVFAITGMLSVYVSRFVFEILHLTKEDPFWLRAVVYIVTVLPAYQVILLTVGTIFGQHKFFKNFLRIMLGRFLFWKRPKKKTSKVS